MRSLARADAVKTNVCGRAGSHLETLEGRYMLSEPIHFGSLGSGEQSHPLFTPSLLELAVDFLLYPRDRL